MARIAKRRVYLDNNATTAVSHAVRMAMQRALKYHWGNPSAGYGPGKAAWGVIERAREQVAHAINAPAHEVYFSSCATEANNTVLKTVAAHFFPVKKKIIATPIEHPSVLNTLAFLKTQGVIVHYCPVDRFGFVIPQALEQLLDEDTFLLCCMYANNEIGTLQNIEHITALAHSRSVLVLSDCVQAFGKVVVDVKQMGVDYATFSAHKLYGPKGIGALYARVSSPLAPLLHGGHQEEGMRAGTESVHDIAGFGCACRGVNKLLQASEKVGVLKALCIDQLRAIKPDIVVNSPAEQCLSNTISVTLPGVIGKELMMMLDYHGICVASGSACSSQSTNPSHVLKAIGLSDSAAAQTIRISLGKDTSLKDIRHTIKVIANYLTDNSHAHHVC
jgi:cysteine desulfurase